MKKKMYNYASIDIYHIEWNELKQLDYIFQVPSCVEKCRRDPKCRHFSFLFKNISYVYCTLIFIQLSIKISS